ncbi:MAG TPA: hypothetical protein VK539_35850 [Myxococcaceae bacterium]|nr:hypothetical protein [Myxococcaceae bacterium]
MRFVASLAVLLFAAPPAFASNPTEAAPKAVAPSKAPELRFAWPVPSRVTVTERILKKGKRSVVRYDAVLSARQGGGYELKIDGYQFLELDGRDLTKGSLPPELKAAAALAGTVPTLVLSAEGQVVDVVGMEEAIERATALVPEEKGMREQVRKMLSQPAMAQAMRQKVADFWGVWVGTWVGTDLAANEEVTGTMPMQLPSGPVDSAVIVRHRGPDASQKGAVRLEMETVLEGEPFRKAMSGMLSQMMQAAPKTEGMDFDAMLKSARRVSRVEVVTDAATLRPYSARASQVTKIQVEDQQREDVEEREYSFAWPAQKPGKRR